MANVRWNGYYQSTSIGVVCLNLLLSVRKYHNHTLQTNPRHREEDPQNTNSHNTSDGTQCKATISLSPKDDWKLDMKLSTALQNKNYWEKSQ